MAGETGNGRAGAGWAPTFFVVAAAVCFGTTGTAQALGADTASALSLGAARIVFGGALLAIVAAAGLVWGHRRGAVARAYAPASAGWASLGLVAVGAVGAAAYQPTFFTGTSQNGVAVGTLVALGSAPVLTGLLDWGVRRRAPGWRWAVSTAVAALGVAALTGVFGGGTGSAGAGAALAGGGGGASVTPVGLLASLGAGLSYAVYALSSKALLERGWSPTATMGATFGAAAVIMLPVLLGSNLAWLGTARGISTAVWLAVITTGLAYTLFARGLNQLPASRAATLTLVEPLTATVLGVLVLHEQFTAAIVAGLVLLVIGLVVLTSGWPRPRGTGAPPLSPR